MGKIQVQFHFFVLNSFGHLLYTLGEKHSNSSIFRCMVEVALKELEKKRLEYEKSPEVHPLYPDEWKIFWNRRYKELQAGLYYHS